MSAPESGPRVAADARERSAPGLEWLFDDPADPSEVTVFAPDTERFVTEWITVDRSTAVPVDELR